MQYKMFKDGIQLSRLGMGVMRLPVNGSDAEIDYEKAQAIIDAAMKRGVNYYDTAYIYHGGKSEELLHTLVDKIVVHEKEVVDGKIILRVDIYYRFIGKVGDKDGEALQAPKIRRNTKLLMEAGVLPAQ